MRNYNEDQLKVIKNFMTKINDIAAQLATLQTEIALKNIEIEGLKVKLHAKTSLVTYHKSDKLKRPKIIDGDLAAIMVAFRMKKLLTARQVCEVTDMQIYKVRRALTYGVESGKLFVIVKGGSHQETVYSGSRNAFIETKEKE